LRDVFVLVFAELVVLALAWCLSRRGRSVMAGLFRSRPASGPAPGNNAPTIDV
jgi:hypothetical protein